MSESAIRSENDLIGVPGSTYDVMITFNSCGVDHDDREGQSTYRRIDHSFDRIFKSQPYMIPTYTLHPFPLLTLHPNAILIYVYI